ncbi:hypothetical protein CALCODRAFT_496410 [Calocera cornea HHB12733]|uniref:Uncharacterized protein n=1 Tax=Calocera cornea HHB12733 TaxID=1353952 RepID=A0A165FW50_9BASI|nr:hypothetical protein CALCODRAFT_496410 [Calocera cornea HHB12733]
MEINRQEVQQAQVRLLSEKSIVEQRVKKTQVKYQRLEAAAKKAQAENLAEEKKLSVIQGKLESVQEALKSAEILEQLRLLLCPTIIKTEPSATPLSSDDDNMTIDHECSSPNSSKLEDASDPHGDEGSGQSEASAKDQLPMDDVKVNKEAKEKVDKSLPKKNAKDDSNDDMKNDPQEKVKRGDKEQDNDTQAAMLDEKEQHNPPGTKRRRATRSNGRHCFT